ncbi:hybrid sensor histidine kinase/response regulator [Massilia litorea]|uniref:histidine kinase n=1 Tax=Massilia litorea TaxID=2769491 RepID=A0A7L9U548_9BURK|nr:PAS domain-containing protein [Massilia litorea]QOL50124.1 PAS domain-containing protein [Massilia litorea]
MNQRADPRPVSLNFLAGGGEMGALMRAHDWSATSLGPPEGWPQALRTTVRLMLNTGHPMFIFWGLDRACLYNDAYSASIGPERHPVALGQPGRAVWEEIWPVIGPQIEQAQSGKGATWNVDHLIPITRHGRVEEVYWTYSYSPIDDDTAPNGVGGVLVVCSETTRQVRAARELANQRDQLAQMFEQAPTFMAMLRGPEHRFELANPGYVKLVGGRSVLGLTVAEALPEAVEQGYIVLLDQVYASGEAYVAREDRFEIQPPDGGPPIERYANFVYQPIKDASGQVGGIFIEGSDVTDQVRSRLQLEALNAELAATVGQLEENERSQSLQLRLANALLPLESPEAIIAAASELLGRELGASRVFYAEVDDERGTLFIRQNWTAPGFASLAGQTEVLDDYGPDMIAQLRAGVIVANEDIALDPRTAAHTEAYARIGVRADLITPLVRARKLEAILVIHDAGVHPWQERELQLVRAMAERTWSAVEAARAQAELREERDRSRRIFDSMKEGFALLDADWTLRHVNTAAAHISRRPAGALIGQSHWKAFPELVGTEVESLYRQVQRERTAASVEHHHVFPSGSQAWIEIRAVPALRDELAVFFRDISERKRSEKQLQESARRKDEFLAMLAHELRNPLAPIGAAAQLLQLVKLDEVRVRDTSRIIARQVEHMTGLVNDLLDVSRVTTGLVTLDAVPVDMRQVVSHAVEQVTPLLQSRRHELSLQLAPDTFMVTGDEKRLVQVLANILNNAAKYTPEGGKLRLDMGIADGEIVVGVADNGIGMDAALVPHVFDLFSQAERTPDRSSGGLGLGLALVKSLVELHRGSVSAASDGPGKGSRFTIWLPRREETVEQADVAPPNADPDDACAPLRIMVVDDNVDAAATLAMLLEALGHTALVEYSPTRALARARRERPDVCLLDIGLPEMDGNELARRLRAQPETARALLVAITGYGQEHDRSTALAAGFDHHMVKPVDTARLGAILAARAGQRGG